MRCSSRWISTLTAIEQDLVADSLVYRYRAHPTFSDGLPPGALEHAFERARERLAIVAGHEG